MCSTCLCTYLSERLRNLHFCRFFCITEKNEVLCGLRSSVITWRAATDYTHIAVRPMYCWVQSGCSWGNASDRTARSIRSEVWPNLQKEVIPSNIGHHVLAHEADIRVREPRVNCYRTARKYGMSHVFAVRPNLEALFTFFWLCNTSFHSGCCSRAKAL